MGAAVGADKAAVDAPVKGNDERVVALEGELALHTFKDVDVVVVGANSKVLSIWAEFHALNPFLGDGYSGVRIRLDVESYAPIVAASHDHVTLAGDGTCALRGREVRQGGGSALLGAGNLVSYRKVCMLFMGFSVPDDDFVIVATRHNMRVVGNVETPGLTVAVREHDLILAATDHFDD